LDASGVAVGFTGDASQLAFNSIAPNFSNNTTLLDYKSMMPDLIIYVSKKGDRKACVGYLRIPLNSLKRPTDNWEHGEDLSIFPHLWDADAASARCLPLKPLVELYQLTSGFLLFKATLTPVRGAAASSVANQCATTKLPPVPRQKYKFVTNVFQAKDMASVDPSGLSSPFATVQIGDCVQKTKHRSQTCFPLWFEALQSTVELPCNLLYAPDFAVTCYHHKPGLLFKFNDSATFMGRADVPAIVASTTQEMSAPAWYPLQFEEHQYGHVLLSFRLTPEDQILGGVDVVQSGIERLIDGWENYAVEVSALDIRGKMATRHKMKKMDPVYQIECWDDIQNYQASKIAGDKFTVYIRKPSNPVFYSSINFRIYEGKELTGVTSIPVTKILRSGMSWYKLMELILREESMLTKRVIRKWRAFIVKKHFVDPRTIRKQKRIVCGQQPMRLNEDGLPQEVSANGNGLSTNGVQLDDDGEEHKDGDLPSPSAVDDDDALATGESTRFAYLQQKDKDASATPAKKNGVSVKQKPLSEKTSLTSDVGAMTKYSSADISIAVDDPDAAEVKQIVEAINLDQAGAEILAAAAKPRNTDAEGNEVFEEKDLQYLQCEQLPNKVSLARLADDAKHSSTRNATR
jgi:hypothetical protein